MDGLLLRITYDFLNLLERKGLTSTSIRVKFLSRDSKLRGNRYKSYKDLKTFADDNREILFSRRFLCSAGEFPVIENVVLTNQNLNFKNNFRWYNITQSRKLIKEVQYDSNRKDIYEREVQRYLDLMNQSIDEYIKNLSSSIKIRLDSYVDPCYVDAGYVSPNSDPNS